MDHVKVCCRLTSRALVATPAVSGIYARGHPPWLASCLRPLAPLYLSASGDWGIPDGLRARRKPRPLKRFDGLPQLRSADWQYAAKSPQLPPRNTRSEPSRGPTGSLTAPLGYSPYQSLHHSQTFPCISYRPQAFAFFSPTGCV